MGYDGMGIWHADVYDVDGRDRWMPCNSPRQPVAPALEWRSKYSAVNSSLDLELNRVVAIAPRGFMEPLLLLEYLQSF